MGEATQEKVKRLYRRLMGTARAVARAAHRLRRLEPEVREGVKELDRERVGKLAARLDYPLDWTRESALDQQVGELLDRYSLGATQFILGKAREFSRENGKKLLVFLFDPYRGMPEMLKSGTRYDQEIVDYLVKERFDYFDMNEVHLRDFKKYSVPFDEYMKEYFIGHYNPRGNHFFAYSVKDTVVKWLDPKPITYRKPNPQSTDFKGYIVGYH